MRVNKRLCYLAAAFAVVLSCSLSSAQGAHAQRTMRGQSMISAHALSCIPAVQEMGGGIEYAQYLIGGYWFAGADAASHMISTTGSYAMRYVDMLACGGYMHRLLGTRSRSINLYCGGGAFLGYEIYDPKDELPSSISTGLAAGTFLYGVCARAEAEFFIWGRLAITAGFCAPLHFPSPVSVFRPDARIGLRYNI